MLTREEVKYKLSKQFGDINNQVMTKILSELGTSGLDTRIGVNDGFRLELKPILIKDYNLVMHVTKYQTPERVETYREIYFDDNLDTWGHEKDKAYFAGYNLSHYHGYTIELEDEEVKIQGMSINLKVKEDFEVVIEKVILPDKAIYDVIQNKIALFGNYADRSLDEKLKWIKPYQFNIEDFQSSVEEACLKNPVFDKAVAACNLFDMVTDEFVTTTRLMILFSEYPALLKLSQHPKLLSMFKGEVSSSTYLKWNPSKFLEWLNLDGNTLHEVLGIPELLMECVDTMFDGSFENILQRIVSLRSFLNIVQIKDKQDVKCLKSLLKNSYSYYRGLAMMGYLVNTGFTLSEINQYVCKVNDTQNVPTIAGLTGWVELIQMREIYKGQRERYIPRNIVTEKSLYERALTNQTKEYKYQYLDRIKGKRAHLKTKHKQYEITPLLEMCYSDIDFAKQIDTVSAIYCQEQYFPPIIVTKTEKGVILQTITNFKAGTSEVVTSSETMAQAVKVKTADRGLGDLASQAMESVEYLVYKKGRGEKYAILTLKGDGVYVNDNVMGYGHMKHLEAWAKQHKLVLLFDI